MDENNLAIVIPAYKSEFLDQALKSLSEQTCKLFKVYIGNDQSPYNIDEIVEKYSNTLELHYKIFDTNLGGKDLVEQWERCIQLVGNEEWVWLFSDDDEMEADCVSNFYQCLKEFPDYDLYHFNLRKINEKSEFIGVESVFPEHITIEQLLLGRLHRSLQTTVVEYIFRKSKYLEVDGFQKFDLAWGSDDATWMKIAGDKGIRTISNGFVHWRRSSLNISSLVSSDIVLRQMNARLDFCNWVMLKVESGLVALSQKEALEELKAWYFKFLQSSIPYLSFKDIKRLVHQFNAQMLSEEKKEKHIGYQGLWIKERIKKAIKPDY